ncbi:MAG: YncE family protein [Treponema sp.]|nr:YncE family protein [Treponema sp.]
MKRILTLIAVTIFSVVSSLQVFSEPVLTKIGTYKCGKQPKQVLFSPDSKYIIMPLLDDSGFDVFSMEEKKIIKRVTPPNSAKLGFAEGLFIPEKNAFFVSQMTTANIYEYEYPGFKYKRTISTRGNWSKFIAYSPEKKMLAVSNWVSNDVSLIDYDSGNLLRMLKTGKAPRGLYFRNKGESIVSLSFDSGVIEQFSTSTGKKEKSLSIKNAAMRHIAVKNDGSMAYISDMYHRNILRLDLSTFTITSELKVFNNPNTIDLYGDRYLFVSCRGPNNPQDYTKRSPVNGKIYIIDTNNMSVLKTFEGGNQPTGLDVSPDGRFLCFSNFQDENIELYSIEGN